MSDLMNTAFRIFVEQLDPAKTHRELQHQVMVAINIKTAMCAPSAKHRLGTSERHNPDSDTDDTGYDPTMVQVNHWDNCTAMAHESWCDLSSHSKHMQTLSLVCKVSLEPMNIDIMGDGCTRCTKLHRLDNIKNVCRVDGGMFIQAAQGSIYGVTRRGALWSTATSSQEFMSALVARHAGTLHESVRAEAIEAAAKAAITNDYQRLAVLMIKSQFAQKGDRAERGGNVAVTQHDFKQLHINIAGGALQTSCR